MTTSSSEQLPARSPMPLIVHSIWPAPLSTAARLLAARPRSLAVRADRRLVDVGDAVLERDRAPYSGRGVADGVGDVDGRRAGLDRGLDDVAEKVALGAGGVFGRKLDVVAVADGSLHTGHRPLDDLLAGHLELELAVDGARGQEDMDAAGGGLSASHARCGVVAAAGCRSWRADGVGDREPPKSPGEAIRKPASMISTPDRRGAGRLHFLGQVHATLAIVAAQRCRRF
jgi:hypothetical protein